ncbi:Serine/threonine-protein kinase PrkC [Planctomycetes bacterium Pla163]|uniref:Serine/threonine-protein kinase PrkC n=1 Tax=Rohdeia mirabilis TaxID=2528008 RepID=A0A518CZY2_9BACT|nr:Serine/threonine-protein kinase PrkC [Planctomycetes bacterium Pla163]
MSDSQPDALVLRLHDATTADGRTGVEVTATPVRLGSDAARADVVIDGLLPLHAVVAPVKGGGFGLKVAEGAEATLDGRPAKTARLAVGARLTLGPIAFTLEARAQAAAAPQRPEPPSAPPSTARPERQVPRTPLPTIPGYALEKQLGKGAMGRVYLAVQENLDRKVAIKVLEARLCEDADFVRAFQSEARAAAALHHPNVVTVFDVGQHDGRHYLALEYMDRGSLEDRLIKEGPLPWRAVLGVLRDAAAGLEYAESKGMVHRDIKPDNLMQNAIGVTKIVDLGLATSEQAEKDAGGKVFGTAHFMAPEQARGEALDTRADLYALGASAWRLLTARTPFTGASSRDIVKAVLTQPAPPLRDALPDLPAEVETLVLDLMAKERDARPATARALRERVEALIQRFSSPGAAGATSGADETKRSPLLLVAAVVVLAAIGLGVAFATGAFDAPAEPVVRPDTGRSTESDATGGGNQDPLALDETADVGTTPQVPPPTPDGDDALKRLEQDAQRVLAGLDALDDPDLLKERLAQLVNEFPGTTAATLASERLAEMGGATSTDEALDESASTGATAANADAVADLRRRELAARTARAQGPDGVWLPPQHALRALLDAPVPAGLAQDSELGSALEALRVAAVGHFEARIERERTAAREHVAAGRFAEAAAGYGALLDWLRDEPAPPDAGTQLPTADGALAPEGADQPAPTVHFADVIAALEEERGRLDALANTFERAMADRDRDLRHTVLFERDDFRTALVSLDLEGASSALAGLREGSRSVAGREWAASAAAAFEPGAQLQEMLRTTLKAGEWRRRQIAIPSERRETREVVSIDSRGLVLEEGSSTTILPLSAFGASSELVDALVNERLARDWTSAEREIVASAMTATVVAEVLRDAGPLLLSGTRAEADDALALETAVARARAWVAALATGPQASLRARLTNELDACDVAASLVRAVAVDDLGQAAWAADELLQRFGDTVLVSCLADGSAAPAPPAWPPVW